VPLILRRATLSRTSGRWKDEDFDVFDGERDVGRIFQQVDGAWFWGVSFPLTGRKSYGHAASLDAAGVVSQFDCSRASRRHLHLERRCGLTRTAGRHGSGSQ
jgi:hypothetical protein